MKQKCQRKNPPTTEYAKCGLHRLQKSSRNPARLYLYRPLTHVTGTDPSSGLVYPYAQDQTSSIRLFAKFKVSQEACVNCVFEDHTLLLTLQYNTMLDYLLETSGWNKIKILVITLCKHRKESAFISILRSDEKPEGCSTVADMDNVWQKQLSNSCDRVLSVTQGTVVQQIYKWPFENNLTPSVVKLFWMSYQGTRRQLTRIDSLYQNFGRHSTSQCSASLGAHPMSKQNHDQWMWKNNATIAHQAMSTIVHGSTAFLIRSRISDHVTVPYCSTVV
jgi:hypothetical protein